MTGLSPVAPFPSSALPEASSEAVPRLVSAQQVRSVLSRPSAFPIFSIAPVGVGRLVRPGMPIVESNLSHGVVARNPDREGGRLRWPGATEMDIACAAETPDTSIGGSRGRSACAVPGTARARRLGPAHCRRKAQVQLETETDSTLAPNQTPGEFMRQPASGKLGIERTPRVTPRVLCGFLGVMACGPAARRAGVRAGRHAAEHPRHHGRRHRLVEHRRLQPGHHGRADAAPRPDGQRGHALHRLLRRGELHRRPRQLHHRRDPDPHRHDHGRPGRRADRHPGARR